jgi:3-deoxy-D-manno-octulosonic acid kinase
VTEAIARGLGWGIVHDPVLVTVATPELFVAAWWAGRVVGHAGRGRGRVLFVDAGADHWALRHYCRGGLPGRLIADRYAWLGESRTRAFREWRMLARLHAAGLPVPRPVAAGWRREGPWYRADLLSTRIPAALPLSARLAAGERPDWRALGALIRRFHDAGACHADLNAHNILVDEGGGQWLLDFDRARIRAPGPWQERNLARLERSLRKIATESDVPPFDEAGWQALRAGYVAGA